MIEQALLTNTAWTSLSPFQIWQFILVFLNSFLSCCHEGVLDVQSDCTSELSD